MIQNKLIKDTLLILLSLTATVLARPAKAQTVTISVTNADNVQRRELAEVDARQVYTRLGVAYGTPLTVKNPDRLQVGTQLTSDSLLLIDAVVRPRGVMRYTVSVGVPDPTDTVATGALYAWRKDDFAWENDLTAYRAYGPALERSGERAFGIDVWVKSVRHPVVASRYARTLEGNRLVGLYQKTGEREKARETGLRSSLHLDHGNGFDPYNVGPTLGCGTPALMIGDSIVMPWAWASYSVLDNGPLRFRAEFVYRPKTIDGQPNVTEHRVITLDKGSYFNRIDTRYDGLTHEMKVCSGVVVHTEDADPVVTGDRFVQYADPTDGPDRHNIQIYTAALFPYGKVKTRLQRISQPTGDVWGHALGVSSIRPGDHFVYYSGAGWTGSGVRDQQFWQLEVDTFLRAIAHPLKVEVK